MSKTAKNNAAQGRHYSISEPDELDQEIVQVFT